MRRIYVTKRAIEISRAVRKLQKLARYLFMQGGEEGGNKIFAGSRGLITKKFNFSQSLDSPQQSLTIRHWNFKNTFLSSA